jgi:WD40 repeat protein
VNTVLADQQTLLARSAESARASAEREREEAERMRGVADRRTEDLRKQLYSSSIGFAQAALQGDYVRRARELLSRCPEDLRGWEWDYLSRLSDTSLAVRPIDKGDAKIYLAGPSADGRIAMRLEGQGIWVFNQRDLWSGGKPTFTVTEPNAHMPVFATGGKTLVWSTVDHWVRAFDIDSGKELYRIRPLAGRAAVFGVSADGQRLLIGDQAVGRMTVMWVEPRTGEELMRGEIVTPNDMVTTFGVSPRGDVIAFASHDGTIGFMDAATLKVVDNRTVKHDRSIFRMVFSADGRYLATSSAMVSLQVTDVDKRQRVSLISGTQSAFNQIAFSADGTQLAGAHDDGVLKIYDPMTGRVLSSLRGHTSSVFGVAYSSDGHTIISGGGDGTLRRWDASPDPDNPVALMGNWPQCMAVSADYSMLAVGLANGEFRLCDPATGATLKSITFTLPSGLKGPWGVSFSRDGKFAAASCGDGSVRIVDTIKGREERSISSAHTGRALSSKFSSDGKLLYSTGDDGYVKVWDVATGRSEGAWAAHSGGAFGIQILPDGQQAVTSGGDGYARLWDLSTRTKIREFKHSEAEVFAVAVSADGTLLATGDSPGLLRMWNLRTGAMLSEAAGHDGAIHCIVFSPDARRLFTGGWDSVARVWDASSLEQLISLRGHQYMLYNVVLTQGGRTLVTSSQDRKLRFWSSRHSDMPTRGTLDASPVAP